MEATVADYLHMLTLELAGQQYNKSEHRRQLLARLDGRSEAAIERKHQNISAILIELGIPYVSGYKPLGNYQSLLFEVVSDRLGTDASVDAAAAAAVALPAAAPIAEDFSRVAVPPPERTSDLRERSANYEVLRRSPVQRDYIGREARNASLGRAGEAFVLDYERWRLSHIGSERLAGKVEHVARTQGDGLGFDILSFEADGRPRLIEVKTTAFGKETPFFITPNEVSVSGARKEEFHLYRLFEFRRDPRLFTLHGDVRSHCRLDPASFIARFR